MPRSLRVTIPRSQAKTDATSPPAKKPIHIDTSSLVARSAAV